MDAGPVEFKQSKQTTINERKHIASFVFWLLLGLLFVGADLLSKYLAAGRVFRNYYFAFSLPVPVGLMYALYGLALVLIFRNMVLYWNTFSARARLAWTMITAGALSNILERLALGYVRDFIYIFTGVFNLADGFIILGIILLFISIPARKTV